MNIQKGKIEYRPGDIGVSSYRLDVVAAVCSLTRADNSEEKENLGDTRTHAYGGRFSLPIDFWYHGIIHG